MHDDPHGVHLGRGTQPKDTMRGTQPKDTMQLVQHAHIHFDAVLDKVVLVTKQ